jgi:hypothetical protein
METEMFCFNFIFSTYYVHVCKWIDMLRALDDVLTPNLEVLPDFERRIIAGLFPRRNPEYG